MPFLRQHDRRVAQAIRALPRTAIADLAHAGPARLSGRALPGQRLVRAAHSGREGVAADLWDPEGRVAVRSAPFVLADESGRVLVEPVDDLQLLVHRTSYRDDREGLTREGVIGAGDVVAVRGEIRFEIARDEDGRAYRELPPRIPILTLTHLARDGALL